MSKLFIHGKETQTSLPRGQKGMLQKKVSLFLFSLPHQLNPLSLQNFESILFMYTQIWVNFTWRYKMDSIRKLLFFSKRNPGQLFTSYFNLFFIQLNYFTACPWDTKILGSSTHREWCMWPKCGLSMILHHCGETHLNPKLQKWLDGSS